MSDHAIRIIPKDPTLVPSEEAIEEARHFMAKLMPEAEEVAGDVSDTVEFRDCGANFDSVRCPECDAKLSLDWWGEAMDSAYGEEGFQLRPVQLSCGHLANSLNDLRYDFSQGFSRFILEAVNPTIEALSMEQISELERLLGCPITVIYQRL